MAESTRQDPIQPSWSWENIPTPEVNSSGGSEDTEELIPTPTVQNDTPEQASEQAHEPQPGLRQRRPEPRPPKLGTNKRMCRFCLDVDSPKEVGFAGNILGRPRRQYESKDPERGRLIHPCLCTGSVKYVHEGCLKSWRNEKPTAYSRCDLCHYSMKLGPLSWATRIRSPVISILLTIFVFWVVIFALGFIADPILDLWFDPVGTIADTVVSSGPSGSHPFDDAFATESDENEGLVEHHIKGLFSLGLLGFVKSFLAMGPLQWWNIRTPGLTTGRMRRGGTGRDRMSNINLLLIAVGVFTFLMAVWRGVRGFFDKTLDRTSERILNYDDKDPADSDDEHEDDEYEDED